MTVIVGGCYPRDEGPQDRHPDRGVAARLPYRAGQGGNVERKTAHDFDQDSAHPLDAYVTAPWIAAVSWTRPRSTRWEACGGMLLEQLSPKSPRRKSCLRRQAPQAERVEYASPSGNGRMGGYFVAGPRPRAAPGVLVIHENRGLNPHIEDTRVEWRSRASWPLRLTRSFPLGGYPGDEEGARAFQKLDQAKTGRISSPRPAG